MKAILVVNLPYDVFIDDCRIEFRVIENVMEMCVTSGVERLKPMPKKLPIESGSIMNTFKDSTKYRHIGFNQCVDEILGVDDD